eukprot:879930-Pleurochrysis_carterae.AAC.2
MVDLAVGGDAPVATSDTRDRVFRSSSCSESTYGRASSIGMGRPTAEPVASTKFCVGVGDFLGETSRPLHCVLRVAFIGLMWSSEEVSFAWLALPRPSGSVHTHPSRLVDNVLHHRAHVVVRAARVVRDRNDRWHERDQRLLHVRKRELARVQLLAQLLVRAGVGLLKGLLQIVEKSPRLFVVVALALDVEHQDREREVRRHVELEQAPRARENVLRLQEDEGVGAPEAEREDVANVVGVGGVEEDRPADEAAQLALQEARVAGRLRAVVRDEKGETAVPRARNREDSC